MRMPVNFMGSPPSRVAGLRRAGSILPRGPAPGGSVAHEWGWWYADLPAAGTPDGARPERGGARHEALTAMNLRVAPPGLLPDGTGSRAWVARGGGTGAVRHHPLAFPDYNRFQRST